MNYSFKLFGGPALEGEQGVIGGRAARGHRVALLALLAVNGAQPITRDKLIALLWPDSDAARARHLLSQSLYLLRQSLGEDAVLAAGDGLRLNPERIHSDVQEFADALGRGDAERAVSVYRGPFLDGFFLNGSPEFERWAETERERFARRYANALEALAEQSEAQGEHGRAVDWWRTLAVHDPYSGRITLALMQALEAAGQRAAAIQHARVHELLLEEIGAGMDPEVAALAERLRTPAAREAAADVELVTEASRRSGLWSASVPVPVADGATERSRHAPPPVRPSAAHSAPRRSPFRSPALWSGALVACLLVAIPVAFTAQRQAKKAVPVASIAVLPFASLSADPANAYFAEGIHEDLLTSLARITSLRVISRTSVLSYRARDRNLRQIARELGVTHVLEGSVRLETGRVLITAQLIDARTDHHVWAEQYHRDLTDIFEVQREIAQRIAAVLQVRLSPEDRRRMAMAPTGTVTAYDLYLRAMDYLRRYRVEDAEHGIGLLQRAVEMDPQFALAYARLAVAYAVSTELFGRDPQFMDSAFASARQAIRLDPDLAEAHYALGTAYLTQGDYARARHSLRRAVTLNPGNAAFLGNLGALHGRMGEYDEAIDWWRRVAELDPRAVMLYPNLAALYAALGMFQQAERAMERALTLHPDLPLAARQFAVMLPVLQADHASAIRQADRLLNVHPDEPLALAVAGNVRLLAGEHESARAYLEQAYELSPTVGWIAPVRVLLGYLEMSRGESERGLMHLREHIGYGQAELASGSGGGSGSLGYGLAAAHAVLGDSREANRWLGALSEEGAGLYYFRLHDPLLANLHGDPDFQRIRATANARLDAMRRRVERGEVSEL